MSIEEGGIDVDIAPLTIQQLQQQYDHHFKKRNEEIRQFDEELDDFSLERKSKSSIQSGHKHKNIAENHVRDVKDGQLFSGAGNGLRKFLQPRDVYQQVVLEFSYFMQEIVTSKHFSVDYIVIKGGENNEIVQFSCDRSCTIWKLRKYLLRLLRSQRKGYKKTVQPLSLESCLRRWFLMKQIKGYFAQPCVFKYQRSQFRDHKQLQVVVGSQDAGSVVSTLMRLACVSLDRQIDTHRAATDSKVYDWTGFLKNGNADVKGKKSKKSLKNRKGKGGRKERCRHSVKKFVLPKSRIQNSGKIDSVAIALWRLLVKSANSYEAEGSGGMVQLETERERLYLTARCRHPGHLPGVSCVNCDLAQLPNGNFFPSSLLSGVRRLVPVDELMDFIVNKIDEIKQKCFQLRVRATSVHRHLSQMAARYIQQNWRLRVTWLKLRATSRMMSTSVKHFSHRRIEKLVRDVYFGDCDTNRRHCSPPYSGGLFRHLYQQASMNRMKTPLTTTQLNNRFFDIPRELYIVLNSRRLKLTLGTKQALQIFASYVMAKINKKRKTVQYANRRESELAVRRMEMAAIAEKQAAIEAKLSLEDYRKRVKQLEMLEKKKEFEALLGANKGDVWQCQHKDCVVRTKNEDGKWEDKPRSFDDQKRFEIHMQLHRNEDREEREEKIAKKLVIKARQTNELTFLEELAVKRKERKELELRRAEAEILVRNEAKDEVANPNKQIVHHSRRGIAIPKQESRSRGAVDRKRLVLVEEERLNHHIKEDSHLRHDMLLGAQPSNHREIQIEELATKDKKESRYQTRGFAPQTHHPFTTDMLQFKPRNPSSAKQGSIERGVVVLQSRTPVSGLCAADTPYLELLHSSLLPYSKEWSAKEDDHRLAGFVPLSNVVNRIGISEVCDVSLSRPIESLRDQLGIAVESIVASFSPVHALLRVDLSKDSQVEVSLYDNHAKAHGTGVWMLSMDGTKAAPLTQEYDSVEGKRKARISDGDKVLLSLRASGCVSSQQQSLSHTKVAMYRVYHLVYQLHVPSSTSAKQSDTRVVRDSIDALVGESSLR